MIKSSSVLLIASLVAVSAVAPAFAGPGSSGSSVTVTTQTVAEREIARRQEGILRAEGYIEAGDKAMVVRDYETAVAQYRLAVDSLPDSTRTADLRARALHKFCDATVLLAEQRIAEGRREDARRITMIVLRPEYDPECPAAIKLLANLEDPDYYNTVLTPGHIENVEMVKKYFIEAEDFYELGRYDLSFKRYEQILGVDPYNVAARRGQEKVNLARSNYQKAALDEARSRAIWEVDKQWERPIRKYGRQVAGPIETSDVDIRGTQYIQNKLNRIIIPKIEFNEVSIREAIDFLKQKSRELDTTESDPAKQGVNIVLKLESSAAGVIVPAAAPAADLGIPGIDAPPAAGLAPAAAFGAAQPGSAPITLQLQNVPLGEALRYVTSLANLKFKVEPYAVSVVPLTENTDQILTKDYRVSPGMFSSAPAAPTGGVTATPTFGAVGGDATGAGSSLAGSANAQEFLTQRGVQFPGGASAYYLPQSSRLIVRNTPANLDLVDRIVELDNANVPTQVEIESKFVEITQNNQKELGFDVAVGPFNLGTSNRVFGAGGTPGTAPQALPQDFPFVQPGAGIVGQNLVTNGIRSGNVAISNNAIDALLFGIPGVSSVAPGILGLGGVFTDPQFQLVIRALNQKKGVDLMSAPRVTTKSGQRAVIEIIREFRYPTEFDPPQIPQTVGSTVVTSGFGGVGGGGSSSGAFPVTPTTPTAFETRNTGVTLEVEPVVGPDGFTIDLNLVPQVVEFEGFINYGSPIQTTSTNFAGVTQINVLTPNVINQPIFSTRKVQTSVTIWDGSTVVLGGLMREDIQKVEDKVPFFGDVPLIGRLFRSEVEQHLKRNLIIFVTARLINPAGELVREDAEVEEIVTPLVPLDEPQPALLLPDAPLFIK